MNKTKVDTVSVEQHKVMQKAARSPCDVFGIGLNKFRQLVLFLPIRIYH